MHRRFFGLCFASRSSLLRKIGWLSLLGVASWCASPAVFGQAPDSAQAPGVVTEPAPALLPAEIPPQPADIAAKWKGVIGTYEAAEKPPIDVFESNGRLMMQTKGAKPAELRSEPAEDHFFLTRKGETQTEVQFTRQGNGTATQLAIGDWVWVRREYGGDTNSSARVKTVRPLEEIRKEALQAKPPVEAGSDKFRKADLVELKTMDSAIKLDIRYASTSNFLGEPVYSQARAFLQRPAAMGVAAALKFLKPYGYGLVIYDGYRPWYVTKVFWEATPAEGKIFVADPSQGSRHNRGCAVDLSLYDLKTGEQVEMPGTYDEMSPRSFPLYVGGTSLQRWRRDLLRAAMERSEFTVYEDEWWHFDYKDWREYGILNLRFEDLGAAAK
jgi:serine beta-lactamase-like protein LACTB